MRVICPNCEQRGLIDAAALADTPARTLCPRCDTPFRFSLFDEEALHDLYAATGALSRAPRAAGRNVFVSSSAAARDDGDAGDVLALPHAEPRQGFIEQPICTIIDWGEELTTPRTVKGRAHADDKYRVGARLLNASPLWLLVVGFAFLSFAVLCDRLLTTNDGSRSDAATLASFDNQATNRDARRHARDDSQKYDSQEVSDADAESVADEENDSAETKPAPVSDQVVARADAAANVAAAQTPAAKPQESAQELTPDASAEASPSKLTLQLASYRVEDEARKLAEKLREAGFEARVIVEQHAKRPWYCVQTKVFDTRGDAEHQLVELRAKSFASSYTIREVD